MPRATIWVTPAPRGAARIAVTSSCGPRVLAEQAARAGVQHVADRLVGVGSGEHHNVGPRVLLAEPADHLQAGDGPQVQVGDHHVRPRGAHQDDGLHAVVGRVDHVDVRDGVEQRPQAVPDDRQLVADQNPDGDGVTPSPLRAAGVGAGLHR
jgi:hypothetical protein